MNGLDALVTGAGRGIGREFVLALLAREDVRRVYAAVRDAARGEALREAAAERAERLRLLDFDVTDDDAVAAAAARATADDASLGAAFNAAGVLHEPGGLFPERRLSEVRPETLMRSFAVNAVGPLLVARHFAPLLPRSGRCVWASLSARVGSIGDNRLGGWYAYRGAKAAQNMFTRNLSIELRRRARGVVVVALHPGTVATGLSEPFQAGVPAERLFERARAAAQLLAVVDGLDEADNGGFFAWDGKPIPW